jgi:hypothetical protein
LPALNTLGDGYRLRASAVTPIPFRAVHAHRVVGLFERPGVRSRSPSSLRPPALHHHNIVVGARFSGTSTG